MTSGTPSGSVRTADGDWQVQTLVQVAWIEENHVVSGRPIRLSDVVDVAEMGVDDSLYGTVVSVEACPAIEDGPGRVVLTTVSHSNDFVFDLTLTDASGQDDVLGVTGWHKIYSESRGWVSASELQIGEVVRGANGAVTVTGLERRLGRFTVYNMTVEADHVYYVGELSALVHNNCPTASQLRTTLNNIKEHVFNGELDAARRELLGQVVTATRAGRVYNHVQELTDAANGLRNVIANAQRLLSNPALTAAQQAGARSVLSEASKILDLIRGALG